MKELKKKYADKGFEILGVADDQSDTMKAFIKKNGELSWPNILDQEGTNVSALKINAFPTYFVINRKGESIATSSNLSDMKKALEELFDSE